MVLKDSYWQNLKTFMKNLENTGTNAKIWFRTTAQGMSSPKLKAAIAVWSMIKKRIRLRTKAKNLWAHKVSPSVTQIFLLNWAIPTNLSYTIHNQLNSYQTKIRLTSNNPKPCLQKKNFTTWWFPCLNKNSRKRNNASIHKFSFKRSRTNSFTIFAWKDSSNGIPMKSISMLSQKSSTLFSRKKFTSLTTFMKLSVPNKSKDWKF